MFGIAVLGTGMIARDMGTAILKSSNCFLAACGSRSLEKSTAFAVEFTKGGAPKPSAYGSYQEAIKDAQVKGVYISLPTSMEEEIAIDCLQAGKHVLADKPFKDVESLKRIAEVAKEKGLLLMDATHFAHNPRTAQLRDQLKNGLVGDLHTLIATFYVAEQKSDNIRLNPELEPMGCVGDLAWYTSRATVEFLLLGPESLEIESVSSSNTKGPSGAVVKSSAIITFKGGKTLVSSVGFTGAWDQSLTLIGSQKTAKVVDYVLDHHCSGFFSNPDKKVAYYVYEGTEIDPKAIQLDVSKPSYSAMFDAFATDSQDPTKHSFWVTRSLLTQTLVDSIFYGQVKSH